MVGIREKQKINKNLNLTSDIKKLEKEQTEPKFRRRKGIINMRAEINEIV